MEREHDQESTDQLLAALYGDGEADVSDPALDSELASFRELRSLFTDLPEADPPSSINAQLISAAAKAVSAKAEKPSSPSLWDRVLAWFEPLRAHPALAAAASLVLVCSIGGILYVNGKADFTDSTRADSTRADSAETRGARSAPASAPELADEAPSDPAFSSRDDLAARARGELDDNVATEGGEEKAVGESEGAGRQFGTQGAGVGGSASSSAQRPNQRPNNGEDVKGQVGSVVDLSVVEDTKKTTTRPAKDPAGATTIVRRDDESGGKNRVSDDKPEDSRKTTVTDGDGVADSAKTERPPPPAGTKTPPAEPAKPDSKKKTDSRLAGLKKKALGFAKNRDCSSVKKIGEQVAAIDEAYYDRTFLSNEVIGACYRVSK